MLDHSASAFESEEGETRALSFRTAPWLRASGYDPTAIVRAPSISRGAATTSDVVRGRGEEDAGRRLRGVARRTRAVLKGRRRKRSRDGTPREAVDHGTAASRIRMRRAQRAPRPSLVWGERVPSIEPFSPPPLDPPAPVARSSTHPPPRGLFTPALDVRSSCQPRPLRRAHPAAPRPRNGRATPRRDARRRSRRRRSRGDAPAAGRRSRRR